MQLRLIMRRMVHLSSFTLHGERAPTETYPTDPYQEEQWPGGWGQLTNRGKFEMYSLGIKLRVLYDDFIPIYYYPKNVKVLSSYADRCLMSAQALLAGLFPPKDEQIWNEELLWQPIPVGYTPRSQDNLIAMKAQCKKYDEELAAVLQSGPIKEIYKENAKLFDYLTEKTGKTIDSIGKLEFLYNTLAIEQLNNLTLPEWTKNISMDHMKELAARSLAVFTETESMKRLKGGVFLKHAISSMTVDNGTTVHLYAAHDISLVNILRTLGYDSIMLKPGFGASLILELHQNFEIKIFYRDDLDSEPEEIVVPNCAAVCLLEDFQNALTPVLPTDWELECNQ